MEVKEIKRKRTKRQKLQDERNFMNKLRSMPEEELSPMAKYWLKHEYDDPVELNMRYVLR